MHATNTVHVVKFCFQWFHKKARE